MKHGREYLKKKESNFLLKHPKVNSSLAILKLIQGYFWCSVSAPVLAFGFPLILVCLLGFSIGYNYAFPGAFCLGSIIIGLNILPSTIIDFKKSTLLKRISVTPINPTRILLSICLFYFFVMFMSVVVITMITCLIFLKYWNNGPVTSIPTVPPTGISMPSLSMVLSHVDWMGFLYSSLIIMFISLACGLAIASFCKSPTTVLSIAVSIMVSTIILAGLAVPNMIVKSNDALWYLGYFISPFKPATNMAAEAWNGSYNFDGSPLWASGNMTNLDGSHIFRFNQSYAVYSCLALPGVPTGRVVILDETGKILDFLLPFGWIVGLGLIVMKKFKWTGR